MVFIEVQHGEYFGEDDIVRLEDDFGRTGGIAVDRPACARRWGWPSWAA